MRKAIDTLIEHVVNTLPVEIHRRREVLNSLICALPGKCPAAIGSMLGDLDRHMARQKEFVFEVAKATPRGSGRLGDTPSERGTGVLGDQSRERGAKGGRR